MELTDNDENQVKAGPDRDKEKKRTRWASSTDASPNYVRYRLTCSIVLVLSWPVNLVNSGACNLWEERPNHTILDMGICTRRSALLASDRTDSSSSRSPSAVIHQLADLDFFAPADPSVD